MRTAYLTTVFVALSSFFFIVQAQATTSRPPSCFVARGDVFGARVVNHQGQVLESVQIPITGEPQISRKASDRGALRRHCETFILGALGRARAKQILRLSD